jgi:hypothetical protein
MEGSSEWQQEFPEFILYSVCEISDSHGGEYEDDSLLGYCAV